jgi:hypothetical protein
MRAGIGSQIDQVAAEENAAILIRFTDKIVRYSLYALAG